MADEYLKLRQFILERSTGAVGFSTLILTDMSGNKLIESATKTNVHSLKDTSGQELCRLRHKVVGELTTEILDTSDTLLATVEVVDFVHTTMQHTIKLIDAGGNDLAYAQGNMLTVKYTVFDMSDKKIATVDKKASGSMSDQVIGGIKQTFDINILEETDTLPILEFIIAIDYILPLIKHSITGMGHARRGGGPVMTGSDVKRPGEGGGLTF